MPLRIYILAAMCILTLAMILGRKAIYWYARILIHAIQASPYIYYVMGIKFYIISCLACLTRSHFHYVDLLMVITNYIYNCASTSRDCFSLFAACTHTTPHHTHTHPPTQWNDWLYMWADKTNFPLNLLMKSYCDSSQSSITIEGTALSLWGSKHNPYICTMFVCCTFESISTSLVSPGSGDNSFFTLSSLKTFTAQGLPLYSLLYTLAKEPSPSLWARLFLSLMMTESWGRKLCSPSGVAGGLLVPPLPVTDD